MYASGGKTFFAALFDFFAAPLYIFVPFLCLSQRHKIDFILPSLYFQNFQKPSFSGFFRNFSRLFNCAAVHTLPTTDVCQQQIIPSSTTNFFNYKNSYQMSFHKSIRILKFPFKKTLTVLISL